MAIYGEWNHSLEQRQILSPKRLWEWETSGFATEILEVYRIPANAFKKVEKRDLENTGLKNEEHEKWNTTKCNTVIRSSRRAMELSSLFSLASMNLPVGC